MDKLFLPSDCFFGMKDSTVSSNLGPTETGVKFFVGGNVGVLFKLVSVEFSTVALELKPFLAPVDQTIYITMQYQQTRHYKSNISVLRAIHNILIVHEIARKV